MATKQSVKKPSAIAERWKAADPTRKKQIMLAAAGSFVLLAAYMIVSGSDDSKGPSTRTAQGKIQNALMPDDGARDLGVSAVSRDVRDALAKNRQLEGEMSRMKNQIERGQSQSGAGSDGQRVVDEIAQLRGELAAVRKEQELSAAMGPRGPAGPARVGPAGQVGQVAVEQEQAPAAPTFGGIRAIHQAGSAAQGSGAAPAGAAPGSQSGATQGVPSGPGGGGGQAQVGPSQPAGVRDADRFYLPAGSILQGVLLSGVDAPSGKTAMKDPIPVLARIKHDAILPNRYRADIKECFALLETVGDLASERAMMRAITLACTRQDRSIIEVSVAGYAVGEDGRAGLRGEVVTKQGAVLGRATIAGFADGLSRAFGGGNNLSFGGGGGVSGASLESGAMSGTSSALDRISQWYLERADELHPTINIDSGRRITIVLTRGRELATLRNSSAPASN